MSTKARMDAASQDAFRQVVAHRAMLLAYVRAIVLDPDLAEDTLQDLSVEIVKSWERFDAARPFAHWARGIARRVALANLRRARRRPALLDGEVLDAIGARIDACGSQTALETRKDVLRKCVERLPGKNRELVRLRYFENHPYEEIARKVERSVDALYTAFNRIHRALLDCIEREGRTT